MQATTIDPTSSPKGCWRFDGTPLHPAQLPGQSVDITLVDPPETDAEGNMRAFSIASHPREDTREKEAEGMIQLKRVYSRRESNDGSRFLIERLWPRGVKKVSLRIDAWLKDAGPSHELRKWFSHDPKKWYEFRRRYFSELDRNPEAWAPTLKAAQKGNVTLLFSSRDTEHNNAVALKQYLEAGIAKKKSAAA